MTARLYVGLLWLAGCELQAPATSSGVPAAQQAAPAGDAVVAAMQSRPLAYSKHAACRMDCRHIDEGDVKAVLTNGERDPSRTRDDGRCPSHALHATEDGRRLRVVYAACPTETLVVTVIDLDKEWSCACE